MLQETLDALDMGLARFDGGLGLLAWNRRLVELMDYPAALMQRGTPFLAFVDFNIARGEHGPGERRIIVGQRLATRHDSYERRRPDGTLLRGFRAGPWPMAASSRSSPPFPAPGRRPARTAG